MDWADWLRRWDTQQEGYIPGREERFTAMLDVLDALLPASFDALDLACGPGAIAKRLLERFREARCVAVDFDPVLLSLGRGALGTMDGRLRWARTDLRSAAWTQEAGVASVDAVLSSTALHWLEPPALADVYAQVAGVVRPGGVFMNADHMPFAASPRIARITDGLTARAREDAFRAREDWDAWWASLRREPELQDAFAERDRLFAERPRPARRASVEFHGAALYDAGFCEVAVIWQRADDRVLLAIR